jgi:AcrR family transcriptional regulator
VSQAVVSDGRRRRGLDNRTRIVGAMLEIVYSGEVAPTAEQVAARADVGLRTVFRHFQDMDSLYREMAVVIEGELLAVANRPFRSEDWRARLIELVERRAFAFEKIGPYQRASAISRHRSKFLADAHRRLVGAAREILKAHLPAVVAGDLATLEALDLLLSFETWARLRDDQGLSAKRAREVLEAAIRKLTN